MILGGSKFFLPCAGLRNWVPEANEEEIYSYFQEAIKKLEKVDADAKKEKKQIVQDLVKDLEGKIPTDRIAVEIVHQLRKVSERLIHDCLDEKYKEKHSVENARKRRKHHQSTEDLAALVLLKDRNTDRQEKKVVIDTLGNEVVEPQSPISKGTDYGDDSGREVISQTSPKDVNECEHCKIKDSRIEQLEDTPADQIAERRDDQIEQLQRELNERTRDLEDKTSQNAKLSDELKHIKELQIEIHKDENPIATETVTNTGDFEFSLLLGEIKYYFSFIIL